MATKTKKTAHRYVAPKSPYTAKECRSSIAFYVRATFSPAMLYFNDEGTSTNDDLFTAAKSQSHCALCRRKPFGFFLGENEYDNETVVFALCEYHIYEVRTLINEMSRLRYAFLNNEFVDRIDDLRYFWRRDSKTDRKRSTR
jgi:hypothetical protein